MAKEHGDVRCSYGWGAKPSNSRCRNKRGRHGVRTCDESCLNEARAEDKASGRKVKEAKS